MDKSTAVELTETIVRWIVKTCSLINITEDDGFADVLKVLTPHTTNYRQHVTKETKGNDQFTPPVLFHSRLVLTLKTVQLID